MMGTSVWNSTCRQNSASTRANSMRNPSSRTYGVPALRSWKRDDHGSKERVATGPSTRAAVRSSATHPLRIDQTAAGDAGRLIGITFCPGRHGPSNSGFLWKRDLPEDLDAIAPWNPAAIVTLIEDHEFDMLRVQDLGRQVRARGIEWHHLPIVDGEIPDSRFDGGNPSPPNKSRVHLLRFRLASSVKASSALRLVRGTPTDYWLYSVIPGEVARAV